MNYFSNMSPSFRFYTSLSLFLNICCISSALSYTDHCSSFITESNPIIRSYKNSVPNITTKFFTGGDRLLVLGNNEPYDYGYKYLEFSVTRNSYETTENGIYKLEAYLDIQTPYGYTDNSPTNVSYGDGSYYSGRIRFVLDGYWSESSRKLCMVGSASWPSEKGQFLNLDAVLKLKFPTSTGINPTIYTSVVSGTLKSIDSVNHLSYFDPISIFSFPLFTNYNYSLVSKELDMESSDGDDVDVVSKNESRVLESGFFCYATSMEEIHFELEYVKECRAPRNCSPLGGSDGFMPHFLSLYPIQCSWDERKIKYLATFKNVSFASSYEAFGLNSTLIGEGSWDSMNNRVFGVGCGILSTGDDLGSVVGDCTLRLSLRYASVLTIRNNSKIKLKSLDAGSIGVLSGLRYEYTELDRVRRVCVAKKVKKKKGDIYPEGQSYDMMFDMSVINSEGQNFGRGYATPFFVGDEFYEKNNMHVAMSPESDVGSAKSYEPRKSIETSLNISYKISINPFQAVNLWVNNQDQVELDAEGVYNAETGQLCMVGCKKVHPRIQKSTNDSLDCEILVNFEFAPLNERRGNVVMGTIKSTREKDDPLYFDDFIMSSVAYYQNMAEKSTWRMDFEISMVLIFNTLICVFVGLQIFHMKRNLQVLSGVSIVVLLVLSLGLVIPFVPNIEALFMERQDKQRLQLSSSGWLEANEVTVRVVTMGAFLLQIRLLQLVWTAKTSDQNGSWVAEKIAVFVSLSTYIFGGLLTVLVNRIKNRHGYEWVKYSIWGDLRSYVGLILDGFLLPQVLLNALRGSAEKVLCHPFYIGTSAIRVVPHAYDQYRARNYPASYVSGTYYYANPTTDFYSTAWDVMIPCGVVALAVIIFLQQWRGGRCILPKKLREFELYEKVPMVDNE